MAVMLYMDVHVPQPVTDQLRRRGVDVLTAIEDNYAERDEEELLERASTLGRVIFTQDIRFKALAAPETTIRGTAFRASTGGNHRAVCERPGTHCQGLGAAGMAQYRRAPSSLNGHVRFLETRSAGEESYQAGIHLINTADDVTFVLGEKVLAGRVV